MMTGEEITACAICGSDAFAPLYEVRGYPIVRCQQCGVTRLAAAPSLAFLQEFYSEDYYIGGSEKQGYDDYIAEREARERHSRRQLREIERYVAGGRLIDVGCGPGFFLSVLGDRWSGVGCELSVFAATYAREKLGLTVYQADFTALPLDSGSFDVITMWDFIEHAIDPLRVLRHAFELLRPGGLLALSTGDIDRLPARLMGKRWHLMTPPQHIYYFSARTMRAALTAAGLAVERIHWPGRTATISHLLHRLSVVDLIPGGLVVWLLQSPLSAVAVRVNSADVMTVYARRPDPASE